MTANEMADELELRLDRSDSFGSPGYEDFEITSVLSEAEQLYVKKFIDSINNRKATSFDETEIRKQGLSALYKKGTNLTVSASQTDVLTNGKFFDLPTDFMYTVYEEAVIDKQICGTTTYMTATIRDISYDMVRRIGTNKYKKPFYKEYGFAEVWRVVFSRATSGANPASPATAKRHQLITDGTFNVTNYSIVYLCNPTGIIVDRTTPNNQRNCILDVSTHSVIVDIAKDLMMNRVKEQKIANIEGLKDLE